MSVRLKGRKFKKPILFNWLLNGSNQTHPTLFQLRSFWLVAGLPIIIAVIVWFCIFKSLGYPDLVATYDGFNRAYEYFKIPLWIAALSLPLAGFYATNHRSVQTAAQIARTDQQIAATENKTAFENYFKHRELFEKIISKYEEPTDNLALIFKKNVDVYSIYFGLNSPRFFLSEIQPDSYKIEEMLLKIREIDSFFEKESFEFSDLEMCSILLCDFSSYYMGVKGVKYFYNEDKFNVFFIEHLNTVSEWCEFCRYILDFRSIVFDFVISVLRFGEYKHSFVFLEKFFIEDALFEQRIEAILAEQSAMK